MANEAKLGKLVEGEQGRDAVHVPIVPTRAMEYLEPGQRVGRNGYADAAGVGIVDPFLPRPVQTGETFWLCLLPGSITSLEHRWTHPAFETGAPAVAVSPQAATAPATDAWRNSTVVALATAIRRDNKYEDMPILADACEEAGCPHGDLLHRLRKAKAWKSEAVKLVCVVLGGELATAVSRIEGIADAIEIHYSGLMEAAELWESSDSEYGDYTVQQGSESWRNYFPDYQEEFWPLYALVVGREVPEEKRGQFFSCSC